MWTEEKRASGRGLATGSPPLPVGSGGVERLRGGVRKWPGGGSQPGQEAVLRALDGSGPPAEEAGHDPDAAMQKASLSKGNIFNVERGCNSQQDPGGLRGWVPHYMFLFHRVIFFLIPKTAVVKILDPAHHHPTPINAKNFSFAMVRQSVAIIDPKPPGLLV